MTGCVCHLLGFNPVIIIRTRYIACARTLGSCRVFWLRARKTGSSCIGSLDRTNVSFKKKHIKSCQGVIYNRHLQNKQLCSCSCVHREPTHINTTATRVKPAAFNSAHGMVAARCTFFSLLPFSSHSINHTQ